MISAKIDPEEMLIVKEFTKTAESWWHSPNQWPKDRGKETARWARRVHLAAKLIKMMAVRV